MSKKLTQTQIDARIVMYDEAIDHLSMSVCETTEEKEQAKIVQQQITSLKNKFIDKHLDNENASHEI